MDPKDFENAVLDKEIGFATHSLDVGDPDSLEWCARLLAEKARRLRETTKEGEVDGARKPG